MTTTSKLASVQAPKIYPQYIDGTPTSKQLQALIKVIDAIIDYGETRPVGLPECLQVSLQWCNNQTTLLMDAMDQV